MIRFEPRLRICPSTRACAPAPDRHHGHDGGHADDDAEHREPGPRLVGRQRGQGQVRGRADSHGCLPGPAAAGEHRARVDRGRDRLVLDQLAVPEVQDASRVPRDVLLVRDEHDGDAAAVQGLEDRHDLDAGPRVEIPGGLVGQEQDRDR